MAGRVSVFGAQALLTSFFSQVVEPPPSLYLALIPEVAPTPYLAGDELEEVIGMGYARAEIPNDIASWSNASQPFVVANGIDVPFMAATGDWGQIRYWALCNAPDAGYVYATGEIEQPLTISNGDQVVIAEGALSISLGPFFTVTDN